MSKTPSSAADTGLPEAIHANPMRPTREMGVFTAEEHGEIHDALTLTLDQLDAGPVDRLALAHIVAHLRGALTLAHRRFQE